MTYLLYKKYVQLRGKTDSSAIELNKKIKHNDINLSNDIYISTYILNDNLPSEKKSNLLAYFKSKDSLNKINEVFNIASKIWNIINIITMMYSIDNFDTIEFCEENMVFEIEMTEIKINSDSSINIYRRFIYDDYEEYEGEDKDFKEEQEKFSDRLQKQFNIAPVCEDDSCFGCPAVDILVGYFNIKFDENMMKKFVKMSLL